MLKNKTLAYYAGWLMLIASRWCALRINLCHKHIVHAQWLGPRRRGVQQIHKNASVCASSARLGPVAPRPPNVLARVIPCGNDEYF